MLYPTLSNYWNSFHQSRVVASYTNQIEQLDSSVYEAIRKEADAFNSVLFNKMTPFMLNESERAQYYSTLNVTGNNVMGSIEIPAIDVKLPIYHGTSETVLQVGIGHIEGTSLPIGGPSTHSVLSGHRGLPSALLFSNLDKVVLGDRFYLYVLNEKLTYEVDQILTVEPSDIDALSIEHDQDFCTLVTCTPYGINSHRLLVRGHRVIDNSDKPSRTVTSNARMIDPKYIFAILCCAPLSIWLIVSIFPFKKR